MFDQERKTAEAKAEVRALENCGHDCRNLSPEPSVDRKKFTAEYISKHSSLSDTDDSTTTSNSTTQSEVRVKSSLNPKAKPYVSSADETVATNLTRFLLKKDLLFSRFTQFNDRLESFAAWKGSFLSIAKELDAQPSEELDDVAEAKHRKNGYLIKVATFCMNTDKFLSLIQICKELFISISLSQIFVFFFIYLYKKPCFLFIYIK